MDNGPHACDLVRLCLGEATTAQGIAIADDRLRAGVEIEAFALFRNHDRAVAEIRSSWRLAEGYLTMEIRGRDGWTRAELAPWRLTGRSRDGGRIHRRYLSDRLSHRIHRIARGCDFTLVVELESFAASCRSPEPIGFAPHATGWDGARAVEMIAAVYQSAALGREIALKPLPVTPPTESRLMAAAAASSSATSGAPPASPRSVLTSRERV